VAVGLKIDRQIYIAERTGLSPGRGTEKVYKTYLRETFPEGKEIPLNFFRPRYARTHKKTPGLQYIPEGPGVEV
jgi:hypothetical protein